MSELINNSQNRKELLKHMILELHQGEAPEFVRNKLVELLRSVPYNEVVEVEQELMAEGMPESEVLKFCDIHSRALEGVIDNSITKTVPAGHPIDTFLKENIELRKVVDIILDLIEEIPSLKAEEIKAHFLKLQARFNELMDVDKHYLRKEYLLFPYLEKNEITGPPKVMWGKHDEIRELIKAAIAIVAAPGEISVDDAMTVAGMVLEPAAKAIPEMIMKEEEILFPMCLEKFTDSEWYAIYQQTIEFGYCLYDPQDEWQPENIEISEIEYKSGTSIQLSTGSFDLKELEALFSIMPIDITFVDADDKVKFFSHGVNRVFDRNRAILGRDVRMCHPPSSVHIVEEILNDFKSGKETNAAFWINMGGKFVYIEYIALKSKDGKYLGTVEFTQEISRLRALEGEQRLLSYSK